MSHIRRTFSGHADSKLRENLGGMTDSFAAGNTQNRSFEHFHHPFVPEYAAQTLVVLDFLPSLRIIKVRGEANAETWIYS